MPRVTRVLDDSSRYFLQPNPIPRLLFSLATRMFRFFSAVSGRIGFPSLPERWEYPDSFWTPHNTSFFMDPDFRDCYQNAISTAGFDYRIPWRVHQVIWAADSTKHLPGDVVEVGTGRGFMMAAVLRHFQIRSIVKNVFLYDLFEQPDEADSYKAPFSRYYANSFEEVERNFSRFPNATLVSGDVYRTLRKVHPKQICFLHVDLNDAEAEVFALSTLWEFLVPGAVVVLDDYANRGLEHQYEAINSFLAGKDLRALTTASGQGIFIKS